VLSVSPSAMLVNTPVIGITKQLMKKIPCIIIKHFNHLSDLLSVLIERPMKKVESANIAEKTIPIYADTRRSSGLS
jgi:hypothetical protein